MCTLGELATICFPGFLRGLSLFLPNIFFLPPLQLSQPLLSALTFIANKNNNTYHLKVSSIVWKFYALYIYFSLDLCHSLHQAKNK